SFLLRRPLPLLSPLFPYTTLFRSRLFTHAGEPTIEVMVLGSDGADGIYGVGVDTELDQLLALAGGAALGSRPRSTRRSVTIRLRSEEHTSELQSRENLVCRLLLEK